MTKMQYHRQQDNVSIKLKGHAGHLVDGTDIVCAAISTLCYTLLNYLTLLEYRGKCKLKASDKAGDFDISVDIEDKEVYDIVEGFFLTGMMMVRQEFPSNLSVEVVSDETIRANR